MGIHLRYHSFRDFLRRSWPDTTATGWAAGLQSEPAGLAFCACERDGVSRSLLWFQKVLEFKSPKHQSKPPTKGSPKLSSASASRRESRLSQVEASGKGAARPF